MRRIDDKWRPPVGLVVAAILLTVMALPLAGLLSSRFFESQLAGGAGPGPVSRSAVAAAVVVLGATLLIGFVFVRAITRPMHELMERTTRIAAGDAAAIRPLAHHGTREMAELSEAFLNMARKLQTRSDTIRTFATHVSHELKTPLTAIQGAAELLRDAGDEMDPATRARFQDNIVADAERLNRLVQRLIELARAESAGVTEETTSLRETLERLKPAGGLAVTVTAGTDVRFRMSPENGAILLSNLADNSARHGSSRFELTANHHEGTVMIVASDDGTGIPPNDRDRIFAPFFTTRRDSGGTGLGLGIVAALLKAHQGTIRLAGAERGATFVIEIPSA